MPGGPFPLWSFREDVYVEPVPQLGIVVVHNRWEDTSLPSPRPAVLEAMRRMSLGPISLDNVISEDVDRRELAVLLDRLQHLVVRSFGLDPERPLISVVPLTQQASFLLPETPLVHPVRLSRFALIRTDGNHCYIESPLSLHRVILHRADAVAQISPLIRPFVPAEQDPDSVIAYLLAAGMAVQADEGDPFQPMRFAEDRDPALVAWSAFDLMFHTRSTLGRHDHDFGVTYPLGEQWSVEPVVKPRSADAAIPLPRPTWDRLIAADPPLATAVEAGEAGRGYDERPLTVEELGELLYRTARVRALIGSSLETSTTATSDRPYPSSGGCYELELYATVDRCDGLPRGVYHYDPFGHRLEPIPAEPAGADELLETGRLAANLTGTPPALLTITARFRRVSWKYDGLSYSLVLKNVGALTQTLSLVSTAMGLPACRLDSGDTDTAPRVLGLDWRVESSVGGFVVGHRSAPDREGPADRYAVNDADWVTRAQATLT
ncbi:SagB family peptide dehydrogenase [Nonomuraea sp. K274]|uniref:SagB family peptide dehydrogenase n=1 Tax=Nonomuraea cypriaca TaxID=1187855 RepID=A0A931EXS7_9ACTN|nr:SagB family peptide dehydrogenase [Nonomuraea cypriaca]MBF8184491.1 SagB family peptide dehydrogenase [Nonomuraea cypriaca]